MDKDTHKYHKNYDKYNTSIPPNKQKDYEKWVEEHGKVQGRDFRSDQNSYDIQGAYLNNLNAKKQGEHYPDTFKKPNHITFSDESIYSGKDDEEGGRWTDKGNGKWSFKPGKGNLKHHTKEEIKNYFKEYGPDTELEE